MSKGSPPAAPDPTTTAAAQTQSNVATSTANAELNRVNQYTPYGSSTYDMTGTNPDGTPEYSQTVSLSPSEQNLFDMSQQGQQTLGQTALNSLGNVQNTYSQPFSTAGLPQVTGQVAGQQDQGAAIQQAQNAAYQQQTQYLDPQFAQEGNTLNASLANQGLQVGDAAYNNAQQMFGLGKQQAYQSAQDSAVQAGDQEQNTLYGQGLSSANLQNSASAQALSQALGIYNQPLNQYNALMTGAQVQNPTFSSVPAVNQAGTDVAGITNSAYQNQLASYNASQQGINNLFSLGGNLGAAAILS
jgi:hypothetical protein